MKRLFTTVFVFVAIAIACLQAQRATELYIPIGKSPGLSREGKTTQGKIESVTPGTIKVGGKLFSVAGKSEIFLDRSEVKRSNTYGKFDDLKVGSFSEVYAPSNNVVEWVKVRTQ